MEKLGLHQAGETGLLGGGTSASTDGGRQKFLGDVHSQQLLVNLWGHSFVKESIASRAATFADLSAEIVKGNFVLPHPVQKAIISFGCANGAATLSAFDGLG